MAILFGNEATGLTNEELSLANVGVMIPTVRRSRPKRPKRRPNEGMTREKKKIKRYGRRRAGVPEPVTRRGHVRVRVHQAMGDTLVSGFNSRLITAEERVRLADELHKRDRLGVLGRRRRGAARTRASSDPAMLVRVVRPPS